MQEKIKNAKENQASGSGTERAGELESPQPPAVFQGGADNDMTEVSRASLERKEAAAMVADENRCV